MMLNVLYAMAVLAILILIIAIIDSEISLVEQAKAGFAFLILFFMVYCSMVLITLIFSEVCKWIQI